MLSKKSVAWLGVGFFLLLDRLLKLLSNTVLSTPHTPTSWFGWLPFHNHGAAFGLPVPSYFVILISAPIILFIGWLLVHKETAAGDRLAYALIFAGAASNLYDRIVYGFTNDYLLLITGVFNLADVLIISGLLLYVWDHKHHEPHNDKQY